MSLEERKRRWQLAVGGDDEKADGGLSERDRRIDRALSALYGSGGGGQKGPGSLAGSSPRVARWLGDIREFFPAPVVQVIQKDAFERLGLKRMLLEPEFLAAIEADVHLVADIISLGGTIPQKTRETARIVIRKVVDELMARLAQNTIQAIRGALNRHKRINRPRARDIDWPRTVLANLKTWQPESNAIVPERLVGFARHSRLADLDDVILCIDQSGSMATSVVYSSIFAAVMASIPAITTRLVVFDTSVVDLTKKLADPVDVLFGIQLGGGTDINQALGYCQSVVRQPAKTHLVLVTDLFEGGNRDALFARAAQIVASGVNLIVLLALSDDGRPSYDDRAAQYFASLGVPVFACTPDRFPDLMATALRRDDIQAWAGQSGLGAIRAPA
ncbi:MAG TPA: VWA domain-containing protein [Rhizomicrobium sp.]|jgi:Mg-chelatase subunit ChlD|nr:VWA domain-containing protein [Rhizomicrobium sp.]